MALYTFLKCSPGDTDTKCIRVHGYNYPGPNVLSTILAYLALPIKRKRHGQVELTPCYSQSDIVYVTRF